MDKQNINIVKFMGSLFCPHCGTTLVSVEKNIFEKCPHLIFAYSWNEGDPDSFIHVRADYAKAYLTSLQTSKGYLNLIQSKEIEPIAKQVETCFLEGKFKAGDETATQIASYLSMSPEETFSGLLSDNTIIFLNDDYRSGIHIAIDFGNQ